MCSGGPTGSIDYPDYMEKIHVDWITGGTVADPDPKINTTLETVMNLALVGGDPYDGESAFDPAAASTPTAGSPLSDMQLRHDAADTIITALDPRTDYGNFVDKAKTKVDESYVSSTEIDNEVSAFETSLRARKLTEISSWTGGMADINAVNGSQFIMGMALIEGDITHQINKFEADLRIRLKEERGKLVDSAVRVMTQLQQDEISSHVAITQLQAEISRLKIVALKEQKDTDLEIDVLDAMWEFNVYQLGANILGTLGGSTMPQVNQPSKAQSAIGGAISGGATGAMIGSSAGAPGAAIGAGIGFLVGGIAGLL